MSSTREHREYSSSSNVVRSLHPTQPTSAPHRHGLTKDHNLDNLLDDLQTSMSRARSTSRDQQYLSPPSNTSTVVHERSVSPGGGETTRRHYKAQYEYSSSQSPQLQHQTRYGSDVHPTNLSTSDVQQNINSLDSLLLDLKHEREHSLDRDKIYSNVGIDDGLLETPSNNYSTTTTKVYKEQSGKNAVVNRELNFDSPPAVVTTKTSTIRQSRSRQRSPVHIETHVSRDISYDSDPTVDNVATLNRSYNYSSTKKQTAAASQQLPVVPHQVVPYNEYTEEIDASGLPSELNGLPIDGGILPGPGTKVTTTIKTFTYEIPGNATTPINQSFTYKNDTSNSYNTTNTIYPAERDIPPSTVHPAGPNQTTTIYKNQTYNTVNRTENLYPNDQPPPLRSVSPLPPNEPLVNKSSVIHSRVTRDTSNTTTYPPHPSDSGPPFPVYGHPGPNQSTYVVQHDVTNTNTNTHHPGPVYPANTGYPSPQHTGPGPKQTYLYKREVTNTKNTVYGPPGGPGGSGGPAQPQPIIEYPSHDGYPSPKTGPTTATYNYTTNTVTRNVHGIHPDDRQPLLQPRPFPVDGGVPTSQVDGNPPKRLDDLLATFGDSNGNGPHHRSGYEDAYNTLQRKEINTALTTGKAEPIVEPKATMKPISGPPVYYPPGKEMFTKSEESQAAWRAQGGYAKASGNYEYESESKSKSSSKSGAAIVPVCLPLCCAMPCSIM